MIPIRTLIIIIIISISIVFILALIFFFFKGGGVSQVFYEFCKITIGNIPFFGSGICDRMFGEI